ncbi:uncharacterized protein LOC135696127 [Rhopilema esculentum]|uniref:uncharacterized protein LOC135696127 n=1 Tax=Rhopilema esculentum TaxID=499914 RepID=UPI0031DF4D9A|eukprot:gene11925-2491_t
MAVNPGDFLAQFSVAFSWDYPDDWSLDDVVCSIFHIREDQDTRAHEQVVCSAVQAAGNGVCLTQPHPETDIIPCEMTFRAHPNASQFCVTNIVVVSEARNVELYVDDMYEKTTKGMMLTLKKGKNSALYENGFDLSSHIQGSNKITLKFVSLPDKQALRLQAVVVKVARCLPNPSQMFPKKNPTGASIEFDKVREMISSFGLTVSPSAQNLLNQVEKQQKQGAQLQQLLTLGLGHQASAFTDNAMSPAPQRQSFARDGPSSEVSFASRQAYEESFLANGILNTEKSKREAQKMIEEQERHAEHDAQISVLKQMLLGPLHKSESLGRAERAARRHRSFHEGDSHEGNYRQMLERFMIETKGGDRTSASESEAQREVFDAFLRSSNRSSFRTDHQPTITSISHASRPVSCCSELSDHDFHKALNDLDNAHKKHLSATISPANSKRCQECGCPGCLSVYNSITTNIYAMEERLVGRMDLRIQEVTRHIDSKFEALYDAFFAQQEKLATQLVEAIPRSTDKMRPSKDAILHRTENP